MSELKAHLKAAKDMDTVSSVRFLLWPTVPSCNEKIPKIVASGDDYVVKICLINKAVLYLGIFINITSWQIALIKP